MLLTDFTEESNGHDLPDWQVWLASAFIVLGFSFGTVQLPSMYARITMTKAPTLARTISVFFACVSFGRCLGPVWGAWSYQLTDSSLNLVAHSRYVIYTLYVVYAVCLCICIYMVCYLIVRRC
jgi:uncharacterized membrane protein YidH (DUF202 family)